MSFDNKMPPIPKNTTDGIAIIFHKDYDTFDIKIVQDIVQSVIARNLRAKFIICCDIERATFWIREYLRIYYIPKDNIVWIRDPFCNNTSAYSSTPMQELYKFKDTIATGNISSVYIFTDNPKAMEVNKMIKASELYDFNVYTINSDANFIDHKNNKTTNRRAFIEGRPFTNESTYQIQELIPRRGFTTGETH